MLTCFEAILNGDLHASRSLKVASLHQLTSSASSASLPNVVRPVVCFRALVTSSRSNAIAGIPSLDRRGCGEWCSVARLLRSQTRRENGCPVAACFAARPGGTGATPAVWQAATTNKPGFASWRKDGGTCLDLEGYVVFTDLFGR